MVEIRQVTKMFGSTKAVDAMTLRIPAGEFFSLLGPNGAGKTTTLKLVAGLLKPTAGSIHVGGFDMAGHRIEAKRLISYIPDIPYVYDRLTGREFLYFIGELYNLDRLKCRAASEEYLSRFYMTDYGDYLMESYSHGMKQKIIICAALLTSPRLIIIDEPMVGLDPKSIRLVKDLLRSQADRGTAVLMSTHTLSLAEEISDRVGIIHKGRLIGEGSVSDIMKASRESENLEDVFLRMTAEE